MTDFKISRATQQRYPIYLKALRKIQEAGIQRIMSKELADYVDIQPTTIRRDFSMIGSMGKQGYGYDVEHLIHIFSEELGVNFEENIILIGVGNLGKALLNYNRWDNVVGTIVCGFDIAPSEVTNVNIPVYHLDELKEKMPKGCRLAIMSVSKDVQNTVDKLFEAGITGIVDLTQEHFIVPNGMSVRTVDIVSKIQELVFEANKENAKRK
ncbi:MAG: redox-sensing transcriptional repressor Rex [Erysipelotrichaceae bacterium]